MDLGGLLLEGLVVVAFVAVLGWLLTLAVLRYERYVAQHGRSGGTSLGDGLGNVFDVFHPAGARANRDLKEQRNVGPVTPTPDPDPDDAVLIERGPDGIPRKVTIRKPR
ncbi:MAG: hypothetical protein ACJ72E_11090 [Marmoricola sp.]